MTTPDLSLSVERDRLSATGYPHSAAVLLNDDPDDQHAGRHFRVLRWLIGNRRKVAVGRRHHMKLK